jgi:hypothetical protein
LIKLHSEGSLPGTQSICKPIPVTRSIALSLNSFLVLGCGVEENSVHVLHGFQCNFDVVKTYILEPPIEVQVIVISDSPFGAASVALYNPPKISNDLRTS